MNHSQLIVPGKHTLSMAVVSQSRHRDILLHQKFELFCKVEECHHDFDIKGVCCLVSDVFRSVLMEVDTFGVQEQSLPDSVPVL